MVIGTRDEIIAEEILGITEVHVNLLVTRRCNYECAHCMYAAGPKLPGEYMRYEDVAEVLEFIRKLREVLPDANFSVNFVGGEPTLDMDRLENVIRWIQEDPDISIEMTTNGWWLESLDTTVDFYQKIFPYFSETESLIRISHSPYHQPFRSESLNRTLGSVTLRNSASSFHDVLEERIQCFEEEIFEDTVDMTDDEMHERNYAMETHRGLGEAYGFLHESSAEYLYLDHQLSGSDKVSPVGRARGSSIVPANQDGSCHKVNDVKFTFMPTKEGERPARLYDPCCNGGKVYLGWADEGLDLLIRRYLFMESLHATYREPRVPGYGYRNLLEGKRCYNCPSFGAKWLRENKEACQPEINRVANILRERSRVEEEMLTS